MQSKCSSSKVPELYRGYWKWAVWADLVVYKDVLALLMEKIFFWSDSLIYCMLWYRWETLPNQLKFQETID